MLDDRGFSSVNQNTVIARKSLKLQRNVEGMLTKYKKQVKEVS